VETKKSMNLKNKNIILCITGSIAAYKSVYLASFFNKKGANVYAVLTKNATKFITPITFKTITKNKVTTDMFDKSDFIPHISLAELADIIVVAPATANIIAKAATGMADDMVSTLLLSSQAPKIIVPAMNVNMYNNSITQINIQILKDNGFFIMPPDEGYQACGAKGAGRFPKIKKIYSFILKSIIDKKSIFYNKKILISLGGTIEDIDPIRYISNRSSGRMGLAFAEELIYRGAKVDIIAGNVSDLVLNNFKTKFNDIKIMHIRSANDLKNKIESSNNYDIYIMAAAVADYTTNYNENKIKKDNELLTLSLEKTDDILLSLKKNQKSIYIGFAAETKNLLKNAKDKLNKKSLDFIIANNVNGVKSAMGNKQAEVFLLNKWEEKDFKFNFNNKKIIASNVLDKIETTIKKYKNK
jgi:phosphopantothenoylcysteine decarboxylase/phosphopantothenate--cysteine ligase